MRLRRRSQGQGLPPQSTGTERALSSFACFHLSTPLLLSRLFTMSAFFLGFPTPTPSYLHMNLNLDFHHHPNSDAGANLHIAYRVQFSSATGAPGSFYVSFPSLTSAVSCIGSTPALPQLCRDFLSQLYLQSQSWVQLQSCSWCTNGFDFYRWNWRHPFDSDCRMPGICCGRLDVCHEAYSPTRMHLPMFSSFTSIRYLD